MKAIICTKDTVKAARQTLAQLVDEFKNNIQLLSFGEVEGLENISAKLEQVDKDLAPEPMKAENTSNDACLIVWNFSGYNDKKRNVSHELLTHEKFFFSMKKKWTVNRNYPFLMLLDDEPDVKSEHKGMFLPQKGDIFVVFAALDGKLTVIYKPTLRKPITASNSTSSEKENGEINNDTTSRPLTPDPYLKSPMPLSPLAQKPYDFKRPKVTVTMEELENADDSEDDDSYEAKAGISGTSQRLQLRRDCRTNQITVSDQSDVSEDDLNQGDESEDDLNQSDESLEEFIDDAVESAVGTLQAHEYLPGYSYEQDEIPKAKDVSSTFSNEKNYCNVCNAEFEDESSLNSHVHNSTYCYNYYIQDY